MHAVLRPDHWLVNLHTFMPGLVIGTGGITVGPLRQALVDLTGDDRLQLNLVQHSGVGCKPRDKA